jgi:hypothetical protein
VTTLEEIKARDAELHYCATCHESRYPDDRHSYTVEECDARLAADAAAVGKPRHPDPETGHLCWLPQDHHPFVEGDIPEYTYDPFAAADRRFLLSYIEGLTKEIAQAEMP